MKRSRLSGAVSALLPPGRERVIRLMLILLVMLAPLLTGLVMTLPRGLSPFRSVPVWGDELWWNAQYAAIGAYGRPLGYFGYAGSHAAVGTWGPWGMFPLLLPGLFVRIFGWGVHAFVYYNYLFLALGALAFILLTRPTNRALAVMALLNALSYVLVCYCVICMNEVVRCAMALVLAGILYRLLAEPEVSRPRRILRYTLVPLFMLYAVLSYTILAVFLIIYLIVITRRLRPVFRRLPAGLRRLFPVCRGIVAAGGVWLILRYLRPLNSMTAVSYSAAHAATSFVLPTFQLRLANTVYAVLGRAQHIDPFYLLTHLEEYDSPTFLLWYLIFLYLLMGVLLWRVIANARRREDRLAFSVELMSLFLLVCYWGGHIVMYNTSDWTFMRGCSGAIYAAVMLCALLPRGERQPRTAALVASAAGVFAFALVFMNEFSTASHFSTPAQDARWAEQRAELAEVIVLDPDAPDPYANTVTVHAVDTEVYYLLPYGVGLNSRGSEQLSVEPRYAVLGYTDPDNRDADVQSLHDNGYESIYEGDGFTVFENTVRDYR